MSIEFITIMLCERLTIGSCVSVRSSRYEARGKLEEHERVARGVAESNSNFLSAPNFPRASYLDESTADS